MALGSSSSSSSHSSSAEGSPIKRKNLIRCASSFGFNTRLPSIQTLLLQNQSQSHDRSAGVRLAALANMAFQPRSPSRTSSESTLHSLHSTSTVYRHQLQEVHSPQIQNSQVQHFSQRPAGQTQQLPPLGLDNLVLTPVHSPSASSSRSSSIGFDLLVEAAANSKPKTTTNMDGLPPAPPAIANLMLTSLQAPSVISGLIPSSSRAPSSIADNSSLADGEEVNGGLAEDPAAAAGTTQQENGNSAGRSANAVAGPSHHITSTGRILGIAGTGDLTTKGKKRKRLARACTACHKNKRRCTGELPCSNCEFSGRECIYLSSAGTPVAPPRPANNPAHISSAASATSSTHTNNASAEPSQPQKRTRVDSGGTGVQPGVVSTTTTTTSGATLINGQAMAPPGLPTSVPQYRSSPFPQNSSLPETSTPIASRPTTEINPKLTTGYAVPPQLRKELVDIFNNNFAPINQIIHQPTFTHGLYTSTLSPILLNSVFALAARFSSNPRFGGIDHSKRGEVFGEAVKVELLARGSNGDESEEVRIMKAQALVLIVFYEVYMGRITGAIDHLSVLVSLVSSLTAQDEPNPNAPVPASYPLHSITMRETRLRLHWMTYVLEILFSAYNSSYPHRRRRLSTRLPLPVSESLFELGLGIEYAATSIPAEAGYPLKADSLTQIQSIENIINPSDISEIGHLSRLAWILEQILSPANQQPLGNAENMLNTWSKALPTELQFTERNLAAACGKINGFGPNGGSGSSGEDVGRKGGESGAGFAVLHSMAESSMFLYLQTVRNKGKKGERNENDVIRQQGQAAENMMVLIESIGVKGRRNLFMAFPILIVTQSLIANGQSPTHDSRVSRWWDEMSNNWGLEIGFVLHHGLFGSSDPTSLERRKGNTPTSSIDLHPLQYGVSSGAGTSHEDLRLYGSGAPDSMLFPSTMNHGHHIPGAGGIQSPFHLAPLSDGGTSSPASHSLPGIRPTFQHYSSNEVDSPQNAWGYMKEWDSMNSPARSGTPGSLNMQNGSGGRIDYS